MKILYISHLSTNIAAGPNWSVPAGVEAQSKIDDVLWVNMTNAVMPHWNNVSAFHNVKEFIGKSYSIDDLLTHTNQPDVVVFESFYYMDDVRMAKKLLEINIPYIIVPRGALTRQAIHNHAWLKKWVAHKLFFDSYVKNATAIQYLTKQEAADSTGRFHTPYFIIPNGFNTPKKQKASFSNEGVRAVFRGRLDMFHKGLDMILEALTQLHEQLKAANFFLDIYGPRRYDFDKIEKEIEQRNISDIAAIHNEVSGKEKEHVLLDADVFMMASRFEGHPMGLIEALAYGVPCMVTPGTNMFEEIYDADAGWTCQGNVDDISKTLLQIIEEKDCFGIKGQNGRELSKRYNWSQLAQLFHNELSSLLK